METESVIKFFIQSYENLESISLDFFYLDFKTNFPIFNNECNTIFKSLKSLRLCLHFKDDPNNKLDSNINNLCENIDKMPNLREFIFSGIRIFNENSYKNFIKKILSLKLINRVKISYNLYKPSNLNTIYTRKELKEMFPEAYFDKFKEISIARFSGEDKNITYLI